MTAYKASGKKISCIISKRFLEILIQDISESPKNISSLHSICIRKRKCKSLKVLILRGILNVVISLKVLYVSIDLFLAVSYLKMRIFIFHQKRQQDLIFLV